MLSAATAAAALRALSESEQPRRDATEARPERRVQRGSISAHLLSGQTGARAVSRFPTPSSSHGLWRSRSG